MRMMKPWWLASALLLANVSAAQGPKALREEFRNPSLRYRMNVNRHSMPREERAQDSMIRWILDNGYRGMATNVNPDDYLRSDDELAVFNRFVHAAKEQGLDLWLYDERSYPSGMAHTYVLEGHPEWEAEGLLFRDTTVQGGTTLDLAALPGERVLVRALPVTGCGLDYDRSLDLSAFVRDGRLRWLAPEGRWTVAEINRSALYEGYQAGTDRGGGYAPHYPSLLLEDVTRRFIETTHRRYASAFDEPLGELFTSTFTDEPSLMAQPYQNPGYGVYPWKENVSAELLSRYGLSLEDGLLRLMLDEGPEGQKLRYRYFRVVTDLLTRNYFGQIRDYCRTQKLLSGGHLLLEECMMAHVPLYGDIMACYRAMDIPGIDNLTGMPALTRRYLYSSRLASSSAELEGRSRVMVESCPISDYPFHGGKEAPTQQVKGTLNRMILGGATDFNNYLQLQHEDAAGRTAVNEYVARVVGMLSGGVRASRIAVYYPIETLWTKFRPLPSGLLSWDDISGGAPEAQQLSRLFERVSDCLTDNGWEFSYLDSRGVEESEVEGGWLVHGDLRWDVLILPGVETLSQQAMDRIAEFVLDGGRLVVLNALPKNSPDEFPSADIVRRFNELAGGAGPVRPAVYYEPRFEPGRLNTLLEGILTRDIVFAPHKDILYAHKRIGGRDVYFITHDTDRAQSVKLSFPGARKLELWNPQNGEVGPLAVSSELTLGPYEGMIVRRIK